MPVDWALNTNSHDGCVPYSSVVATPCEYCSGWKVNHSLSWLDPIT